MTNPKWLEVAAQRSGERTWTLGYVFEQYLKHETKSREQLAAELGCSLEVLNWLALCRCPDEERFEEQLEMIEKRFAVESYLLAGVIRRVEVLNVLTTSRDQGDAADEETTLIAARDHTSDDETSS